MTAIAAPHTPSPWHEGERAAQARVGVAERMEIAGRRSIRAFMPDQHREFFAQLPFLVVGSIDEAGWPWASILSGKPGFATSPDPRRLDIAVRPLAGDPLAAALVPGAALGILGIELATRRRNRANGRVAAIDQTGFSLAVEQSFGNCPQYIQLREEDARPAPQTIVRVESFTQLGDAAQNLIRRSDTFFVASFARNDSSPASGGGIGVTGAAVDVSHRGGQPGFIGIAADGAIVVPDYPGNRFFNTLGNLLVNPRAGLLFIDFATGDLLQVAGTTEIVWEGDEIRAFRGAERLWRLTPVSGRWLRGAWPFRLALREVSPNALVTGTWDEAQATLAAERSRDAWRRWRIARIVDEAPDIRSFHLEPADGGGVPQFAPGQHLPIRFALPGEKRPILRNYSLSSAPGDGLRISVKRLRADALQTRDGLVSTQLHTGLAEGALVEAVAPRGDFVFDAAAPRPAVLLSAGIGITPMIAMLRHAVRERVRTRKMRPIYFIHGARTAQDRPFRKELRNLAQTAQGLLALLFVSSQPADDETAGTDHHATGRITVDLLKRVLPFDAYDFYLCGPAGFMQSLYDGLAELGVPDARIHAEAFGPSALKRRVAVAPPTTDEAASRTVRFQRSGKEARWTPASGSLLALAEASGLDAPYSCRTGSCGTCATRVVAGAVDYLRPPLAEMAPGEALICSAVPRGAGDGTDDPVVLDL
jgi:ferredoxin-NADP reductase/predicted pyridoxine 5'-phosphate oxidase superfamily flavin-nucleotide-binding protein